jgi:hypothetical protein
LISYSKKGRRRRSRRRGDEGRRGRGEEGAGGGEGEGERSPRAFFLLCQSEIFRLFTETECDTEIEFKGYFTEERNVYILQVFYKYFLSTFFDDI